jgi:PAS domain S-box-containing protein
VRGGLRLYGSVSDITERHRTEEALVVSESQYRYLYENTPAMMHSIDREGRLVSVSRMWLQKLGYVEAEVLGRPSTEFMTPESQRYAEEYVLPAYFRTGTCRDVPYAFLKKDGTVLEVLLSGIMDKNPEGEMVRSLAVLVDVTELRRAEEERNALAARERDARAEVEAARELDRLKTNFVNAISHDLRTPLTSILGYAEFLEDEIGGPVSPDQRRFVVEIVKGARRLEHLVDDLLDFARFDAGTLKLKVEGCDLAGTVDETLRSLRPQVLGADLQLEADLPAQPVTVWMDCQRIERVLINLVNNAIKFTPPGGRITVRASLKPDHVRYEVVDTGVGISPADLPRLFERFVQLGDGATKGGTGLGLSISKAIVEAHHGEIGVESAPDAGSTFWFTIPLQAEPAA